MFSRIPSVKIQEFSRDRQFVLRILIVATLALIVIPLFGVAPGTSRNLLFVLSAISFGVLVLAYFNYLNPGRIFLPVVLSGYLTYSLYTNGLRDTSFFGIASVIIVASMLLGRTGTILVGVYFLALTGFIGVSEVEGNIAGPLSQFTDPGDVAVLSTIIVITSVLQVIFISRLNESVRTAQKSELISSEANRELRELQADLEKRVFDRTNELETSRAILQNTITKSEKQASQLRTISDVSRAISTVQELDTLLPAITRIISDRFGYYHVGIFLLDNNGEYAVLRAANSAGGQRMLAREHKLGVGETGIVGYVAASGNPRIALDTGEDAIFFNNPDLPQTRSEIGLPLRAGEQVIGVLDVQSVEANAFLVEDIDILNVLAGQVSVAIQNAQLFESTNKALAEAQVVSKQYIQEKWQALAKERGALGYRLSGMGIEPITKAEELTEVGITANPLEQNLNIPLALRGETIGFLTLKKQADQYIDPDEVEIVRAVAERMALAIENARLFDDAQRRASKERIIGDISGKISAAINMENILQTAVAELGRALPNSEVVIQLEDEL